MGNEYPTGPIDTYLSQIDDLQKFKKRNKRRFDALTEREQQVLALVAEGMNNPKIAEELDISRVTVQNHRAKVRDKLNINNQVDFVKFALAYELIDF